VNLDQVMKLNLSNLAHKYLFVSMPDLPLRERSKSALGTAVGVGTVFLITYFFFRDQYAMLAAVGSTGIILFTMPQSPMGQPWSIVGSYGFAVLIGLGVYSVGLHPILGIGLSIALVVWITMTLKCVHPPAGAITVYVFNQHPENWLDMVEIASSSMASAFLLLLIAGVVNNFFLGRKYPQCQPEQTTNLHHTKDTPPSQRAGLTNEDLDFALQQHGTYIDVQESDLIQLYETAVNHAFTRKMNTTCADIMARDVISITQYTKLDDAWALLRKHKIKALPVIDTDRKVIGIVTVADFLKDISSSQPSILTGLEKLKLSGRRSQRDARPVRDIMSRQVFTESTDAPVSGLIKKLSDQGLHHVPIVNAHHQLVGMITQSDLIASMYQKVVLGMR